jgi:hypothetical protein
MRYKYKLLYAVNLDTLLYNINISFYMLWVYALVRYEFKFSTIY